MSQDTAAAFLAIGAAPDIELRRPLQRGHRARRLDRRGDRADPPLTACDKPVEYGSIRLRPPRSEVRELLADNSRLRRATGWAPRVELAQGLEQTVAWWRLRLSHGKVRREKGYAT